MGELIELPTPFQLHRTGTWQGEPFEVQGCLQMDRADQASAPWQEMLVHFPMRDGHTWVAYAQGRWYATTETAYPEGSLPPFESLSPGGNVQLGPHGVWVIQEISQRRVVSGRGAMTGVPAPGVITRYADVSAEGGRFGTIDYGDGSEPPVLYLGKQFDPAEVQFEDGTPLEAPEAKVSQVECPNCGGSLPIQSQAAERVVCQYCGTASDMRQGALAMLGPAPMPPIAPAIPIGQQGDFRGQRYVVTGFMIRSCIVEGVRYDWREYLLFGGESVGYRWLTEEDGAWSFVEPLDAGAVQDSGNTVIFRGQACSFKQSVQATVDYVIGEFYWKVEIGETVEATEYQGPAGKISRERTDKEVNYAVSTLTSVSELSSFGLAAAGRTAGSGVPRKKSSFGKFVAIGCGVFVVLPMVLAGIFMGIAVATINDFEDVESGEIALDDKETAAMKKLIAEAGLSSSNVTVHDDQTSRCDWCNGIVIEKGHVTLMRLEGKGIKSTAPLEALDRLEVLKLPRNQIGTVEGLGGLAKLQEADLSQNRIAKLADMSGAESLEKLDLRNNQLASLAGLRGLSKLKELHVEGNPVQTVEGMDGLARLERLELSKAKLKGFRGLGKLPALKVLSAKGVGLETLEGLDGLSNLEELHVPDNRLSSLEALPPLSRLRFIDASGNQITSLAGVENLPALKKLLLARNQIVSLEGEKGSSSLETLDVSQNRIAAVDDVAPMPRLMDLKLDGNQLAAVGGLTALVTLTALSMGDNRVTDLTGAKSFAALGKLNVSKNRLTSLDPIVGMSTLQSVDARNNRIDNAGAKAFLANPPKNYDLSGNVGLPSSVLRRGSYVPSSSSPSGKRSPSSRYRSGGGPRFGK
jgi:Leucine-rich repeat (LRR) protein/ribosomal protein S27E